MSLTIAAGLLRRGTDVLMVQQEAPTGPAWTVPAGRVEPGELPVEALVREMREETSLTVLDPGEVAFVVEVDDRRDVWAATIWTWAVAEWEGEVAPDDPEILDAGWMPLAAAVEHLEGLSWHSLTARCLRGELEADSRWSFLVHVDGRVDMTPLS